MRFNTQLIDGIKLENYKAFRASGIEAKRALKAAKETAALNMEVGIVFHDLYYAWVLDDYGHPQPGHVQARLYG